MKRKTIILIYLFIFILFIIGILLAVITLDKQYMWSDEVFSFEAGRMILEKGQPIFDSGLEYYRAVLYHKIMSFSMGVFGVDEFGSRILNIFFSLGSASVVFLLIKEIFKSFDIKKEVIQITALTGGLMYLFSNFSIAMMRETRMYSFSTLLLLLTIYFLYMAILCEGRKKHISVLGVGINIPFAILTGIFFLISYETQPINIILGLGILVYFLIRGIWKRNYKDIVISLIMGAVGILVIYFKFNTLDIGRVFQELSPSWATTSQPIFYAVLTLKNIPLTILSLPILIGILLKSPKDLLLLLGSIVITFLLFLSFQNAQHERYWQGIVPIIFTLSVPVCILFFKEIKRKVLQITFVGLLTITGLFHTYLTVKEFTEINTYTSTSLSIHKKLEFNNAAKYIKENIKDDDIVIADFHSAYTLIYKGIQIDYLILEDGNVNWEWGGYDKYFDIPLLSTKNLLSVKEKNHGFLVIRDGEKFRDIDIGTSSAFERPQLYRF